ncbi:MAG TPA: tetratricopeptide repeat protein [Pyrinomonadaceae bacterium]|jgi:Tfp pilus assembly protein PilF
MNPKIKHAWVILALLLFGFQARAQIDDICAESGLLPSLESPFARVPYVFGKVTLRGFDPGAKFPKVTVTLTDSSSSPERRTINKSGNYCFKRRAGVGTLTVDVDGVQAAQRTLSSFGPAQQREDFEIYAPQTGNQTAPGVISAKFSHPPNPQTVELYKKAVAAETEKNPKKTIELLEEIVAVDAADFIAWAKLGVVYFGLNSLAEADAAFRKSLELKAEYTPAWINVGKLRMAQKQYEAAIEIFKHAAALDPQSASAYQNLGEAYLLTRQGTLGAAALNEALRLDPLGMAEIHLQLAHLYALAGAKNLAAREYRTFLEKVPNHPERKKLEKFIKDNPE